MVESDASRGGAGLWFASPLLLALVGLVGTGVGAVLQGFWNTRLERETFEFSLIQKALDTADKDEAGRNLKFLVEAGLISQFDGKKIEALASTPDKLPSFLGASSVIPVQLAKRALASLDMYKGPINDEDDEAFRKSSNGLPEVAEPRSGWNARTMDLARTPGRGTKFLSAPSVAAAMTS